MGNNKNVAVGFAFVASGVIGSADGKIVRAIANEPGPVEAARFVPSPFKLELHTLTSTGESVAAFNIDDAGTVYRW